MATPIGVAEERDISLDEEALKKVRVSFRCGYNTRDAIIYALGIGCDAQRYVNELDTRFAVFPTYPLALFHKGEAAEVQSFPQPSVKRFLHATRTLGLPMIDAEVDIQTLAALPTGGGTFVMSTALVGASQKGPGVIFRERTEMRDARTQALVCRIESAFFCLGAKLATPTIGPRPPQPPRAPDRPADRRVSETIPADRALLYRLSGDYNQIHASAPAARAAGLDGPILHGRCTLGMSVRAVLAEYADGDPRAFRGCRCRFVAPVSMGDTLVTSMWRERAGAPVVFEAEAINADGERRVVLRHACVELAGAPTAGTRAGASKL